MEFSEYSDYIIFGVATILAGISWMLKKEHNRIAELEGELDALINLLS